MDIYEMAIWITGYRRRLNEQLRINRQNSYWNLIPYLKEGENNTAKQLGLLPDEVEEDKNDGLTDEDILAMLKKEWGDN